MFHLFHLIKMNGVNTQVTFMAKQIIPGRVAGVQSTSNASWVKVVGMAPAQERWGNTRETKLAKELFWGPPLSPEPWGLWWLAAEAGPPPPGRAGDGRGIPGDPGQVLGAGDAILCGGKGLFSTLWFPLFIPAGFGEAVGSIPAGLGAWSGFAKGELAIPKALPGPTGEGWGSIDGDGFTPPDGGIEGGEAKENDDVAGLEPKAFCCCCCCCCWTCCC